MQVEEVKLGQLNTLFIHNPGSTASTVQMWFRAGSALEDKTNQGIAHFLEHMFFKGIPKRPGALLAQEIESFGGEVNAFTSFDYTCYYINSPARKLDHALEILLDMVANPMFNDEDFPSEREVVFEEYRRALDNPSQYHFMQLQANCFQGGYQHPILGREDTIKNFSPDQLKSFRKRFYNPKNAMIVVAGDLTHRKELEKVISHFKLPEGEKSEFELFTLPSAPKINVHDKKIRQATLTMALSAPDYTSTEASAEDLAINCIAHGETSRLYQALVAQSSICNGIAGSSMFFAHQGCHMIKASFPVENLAKVLKTFNDTLKTVLAKKLTDSEVTKIKNQYVASKVYEKESIESFAFTLGHGFAQTGDVFCEDRFIQGIRETSVNKVNTALPEIFSRPMHLTMQAPEGTKLEPLKKQLHAFQAQVKKTAQGYKTKTKALKKTTCPQDPAVTMVEIIPGIKLIHRLNRMTPTFVLHTYIKGGITTEGEKDCGRHNMLAKLLTYGYKGVSYEKLKLDLEARSAALSGFSGKNAYGLTMHGQSQDFDALLGHYAGTLLTPAMPEKYLKHERQVTLRMLENQKEDPVKQAFKNWYNLVFKSHPYSLDTSGTVESLKAMNPKVLSQIHKKHLKEEITLITYCGDHDLETVIAKLEKALAPLKGRKGVAPRKNKLTAINGKRLEIDMPREQVQMVIGRPAFKLTDVKDIYLKMITAHLSGQGSELFVEVRDRQGLCYAVQPVHVTALEAGCWGIYIGAGADKKERAEIAILNILNRIGSEGISREEFDRVKSMLEGQQQLSVQTNEDFAQFYSVPALHGLGLEFQHDANEKVSLTKYEEFQAFLKEFMKGPWNTVIVGPNSPS